jgi:hypothetical protein
MKDKALLESLLTNRFLAPVKKDLIKYKKDVIEHPVFSSVSTLEQLRIFMEHHVFAVYDFMCVLKELQGRITCTTSPWLPKSDKMVRRFVNHMVLEEETDEDGQGGYGSHLEMYVSAMEECGADTGPIKKMLELLKKGTPFLQAVEDCGSPLPSKEFNRATWEIIETDRTHCIASAFTFGREDPIPNMFRMFLKGLGEHYKGEFKLLRYYLDRHIHLDEDFHNPMAQLMVINLCGEDPILWWQVQKTAMLAIEARKKLWDGTLKAVQAQPVSV